MIVNTRLLLFLILGHGTVIVGCGRNPEPLSSAWRIAIAPADIEMASVANLPLRDYPLLAKFKKVRRLVFFNPEGTGADDERLKAVSKLNFPKLMDVSLRNCPAVTDEGVASILTFQSLELLQLEGTSTTDAVLLKMVTHPKLRGVNVAGCPNVTFTGVSNLSRTMCLKSLSFSLRDTPLDDVLSLMKAANCIEYLGIIDPAGRLDPAALEQISDERGITIIVRPNRVRESLKKETPAGHVW